MRPSPCRRTSGRRRAADWSDAETLAARISPHSRPTKSPWRGPRSTGSTGSLESAGPGAGFPGAGHASTCGARSPAACAPAAMSSSCRGAGAARVRGRSCCSATSAARWNATRACCCTSPMPSAARHRRVEAFLFSTQLTRITMQLARAARRGGHGGRRRGAGLVGRHPNRRCAPTVPSTLEPPGAAWRPGGAAHLRRMGPRRSDRAARSDQAPAAKLPPPGLAQPAHRQRRLRAADTRPARRASVRRRFPARSHGQRARGQEVVHEGQRRLQAARQRCVVEGTDERVEPD